MSTDYMTIASAPRDGTLVEVTDLESGFFPMMWNTAGTDSLVSKDIGSWEAIGGTFTWCEDDKLGPTHWCPIGQGRVKLTEYERHMARQGVGRDG